MTNSSDPVEPIDANEDMHALLERFAVHLAARNYSPYTIEQRVITGTAFIAWAKCAGVCRVQDVSRDIIERYRIHLFNHRKANGEPLILISHNMRQVFDLVDRIVVFRRGRIVANLNKSETNGEDVVSYITGAKTAPEFASAA